jgi:hypothetical protein
VLSEAAMMRTRLLSSALFAIGVLFAAGSAGQQTPPAQPAPKAAKPAKPAKKPAAPAVQMGLEPRAIDILKAASARLAAAKSMAFTAIVSYESPSRLGPPLIYSTKSEVTLRRPDKLKVITLGDGPPSEFYYDGKIMMAYAPTENLVAVADAPPTIDTALQVAYDSAAIYFPFTDLIVADPYKDIADGLKVAFYIGQSIVVDGTTTDMVAYVTGDVFVQAWIGAEDKLPRRVYAVYLNDRARLRHVLALSNWKLDADLPADAFASAKAAGAARIGFARPDAKDAPGMKPPPKAKTVKAQPAKAQPAKAQPAKTQ